MLLRRLPPPSLDIPKQAQALLRREGSFWLRESFPGWPSRLAGDDLPSRIALSQEAGEALADTFAWLGARDMRDPGDPSRPRFSGMGSPMAAHGRHKAEHARVDRALGRWRCPWARASAIARHQAQSQGWDLRWDLIAENPQGKASAARHREAMASFRQAADDALASHARGLGGSTPLPSLDDDAAWRPASALGDCVEAIHGKLRPIDEPLWRAGVDALAASLARISEKAPRLDALLGWSAGHRLTHRRLGGLGAAAVHGELAAFKAGIRFHRDRAAGEADFVQGLLLGMDRRLNAYFNFNHVVQDSIQPVFFEAVDSTAASLAALHPDTLESAIHSMAERCPRMALALEREALGKSARPGASRPRRSL